MKRISENYKHFYIYKITNLVSGKIYVGQRSSNKSCEKDPYMGSGIVLKKSIKKYGKENFKKELIEYTTPELIDEREIFWIKELDSMNPEIGYNLCFGGRTSLGLKLSEEQLIKLKQKFTEEYRKILSSSAKKRGFTENAIEGMRRSNIGKRRTEEVCKKISEKNKGVKKPYLAQRNKEKCSQPVLQFTTEGVFVNKFESAKEAKRQTNIHNIQLCTTKPEKYKAVGGFIWIWEKDFSQELLNERIDSWNNRTWGVEKRLGANNGAARIIEQLDAKTGELIQEFGCIRDAKKKIGNGKGDIGAACRGEQKTACGFKWRYKQ